MVELLHIPYSPWSEKARWALDHHHIEYRATPFVPMVSEPVVRLRLRLRGRITAPLLVGSDFVLRDSFDIARWAEDHGEGAPLFPVRHAEAIAEWNGRSERLTAAGRGLVTARVLASDAALLESAPRPLRSLRGAAVVAARTGARYLVRKYGLDGAADDERRDAMRVEATALRAALAGGRDYILGEPTYADLAMATALQMVRPVADTYLRLEPATREAWTDPVLSGELGDLLEWRDRVYEEHR